MPINIEVIDALRTESLDYTEGTVQKADGAMYIHVQEKAYGDYSHLIIVGATEACAYAINDHWQRGKPVRISYDWLRQKDRPAKHTVAEFKGCILL